VFWIPGYPGPPAPGPLQRPSFGPGVKRWPKPSGEDPHEGKDHIHVSSVRGRTTSTSAQYVSVLFLVRGRTTSTSAQYVSVLSKKIRAEDCVPSMLPRQGGDQLSPCLHKAAQWLLATPLKIAWTVQGARGGRQLPPPTPVDQRHYSTKTTSTEDSSQQLSLLLGRLWQPLPQDDKGKEDLGAIKDGEATP
jgi:hypothetical protein